MESTIAENYQALTALIGWIVEAMEFVPLPDEAKAALDVLISTQDELKERLHTCQRLNSYVKIAG